MIRDAAGKLTGLVVGMETWLSDHLPLVTAAESESRARIMSREMAAAGVTAFTDATTRNGSLEVEQFAKLAQSSAICQRVGVMIGGQHLDDAERCEQLALTSRVSLSGAKFSAPALSSAIRRAEFLLRRLRLHAQGPGSAHPLPAILRSRLLQGPDRAHNRPERKEKVGNWVRIARRRSASRRACRRAARNRPIHPRKPPPNRRSRSRCLPVGMILTLSTPLTSTLKP